MALIAWNFDMFYDTEFLISRFAFWKNCQLKILTSLYEVHVEKYIGSNLYSNTQLSNKKKNC